MSPILIEIIYGLSTAGLGAVSALWLCRSHFRRQAAERGTTDSQHAADVLVRLRDLANRVALDVDLHSSQVEQINERLTSANAGEPSKIVDVVAKLIEANQRMQEKLSSTEDKLREQAQEIQTHAAEARTDGLTLLANRRAFDDELTRCFDEFRRRRQAFALIMTDVDRFKRFNDTHGHQAGDEVLRTVARVLRRKMRELDIVARYGGEEFAIILPATALDVAGKAALRAGEAVEKAHVRHGNQDLRVTMSFGVAESRSGEDAAALIARADKALYASKQNGRNCTHQHDGNDIVLVAAEVAPVVPAASGPAEPVAAPSEPAATVPATGGKPTDTKADPADGAANTGLPSRTTFCQHVRNRMAEWKRGGPAFSVVLVEVNQDHRQGEVLDRRTRAAGTLATTQFLLGTIREMDVLGQYGSSSFGLLLPTAGLADAIRVAERLREGFSRFAAALPETMPKLTLSVGVVQALEEDDSISLLKRAEAALDAADRRGGDRAYFHDGDRCAPITAMLETMGYLA